MSTTVSNPYSFNISKNTGFDSSIVKVSSTFECEFKITACKEFIISSNEYGQTKMCGYYKDFSYTDLPEYVFDLGSIDIINISNGCSLLVCDACMDAYANNIYYSVGVSVKVPSITKKDTSIYMKTYIMDSNNNIIEAKTLTFTSYNTDSGIAQFDFAMSSSMFDIYNTIVSSQKSPRYIKLYIK